jgi:hypothetical protein
MPRPSQTITDIINNAVADAMAKIVPTIQRQVAVLAAEELEKSLAVRSAKRSRGAARNDRARPQEITKWAADRRARRVPTFVIELTGGIDTKKKIVAKFGPGVVFEKGKPLPKPAKAA